MSKNLSNLGAVAARKAQEIFLIEAPRERAFTHAEFDDLARRLAGDLRARGVAPGDRLALVLPNSAEFAALYFASMYLQATVVPINPILHRSEVEYIVRAVAPRLLIYSESTTKQVEAVRQEFASLRLAGAEEQAEAGEELWVESRLGPGDAWEPFAFP